jgi:hypothetical protein
MWQVSGRNHASFADRVGMDVREFNPQFGEHGEARAQAGTCEGVGAHSRKDGAKKGMHERSRAPTKGVARPDRCADRGTSRSSHAIVRSTQKMIRFTPAATLLTLLQSVTVSCAHNAAGRLCRPRARTLRPRRGRTTHRLLWSLAPRGHGLRRDLAHHEPGLRRISRAV